MANFPPSNPRDRNLLVVAVLFLALIGVYAYMVYMPKNEELALLEERVEKLQKVNDDAKREMAKGSADEQKPAAEGTVEAWGRSSENPVGGWYGIKKGLRGRFGNYEGILPEQELGYYRELRATSRELGVHYLYETTVGAGLPIVQTLRDLIQTYRECPELGWGDAEVLDQPEPSVLALRTTCIVGFPGETADDFQQLLDFVEEVQFDRVGAFAYSPQEGTRAHDMTDDVPDFVKRERLERLTDLQRSITAERYERRIGQVVRVLVDRPGSPGEPAHRRAESAPRSAARAACRAARPRPTRILLIPRTTSARNPMSPATRSCRGRRWRPPRCCGS